MSLSFRWGILNDSGNTCYSGSPHGQRGEQIHHLLHFFLKLLKRLATHLFSVLKSEKQLTRFQKERKLFATGQHVQQMFHLRPLMLMKSMKFFG